MAINNATNVYSNSRYIVDNVATGSPFTTIQSAINAAVAAGGAASIWVRQGTYTENLTLYSGIDIEGQESSLSIIIGTHTPPAAGSFRFTRLGLQSATHIFSSAVAGSAILGCIRCQFNLTNGYVFNVANWTGDLHVHWCIDDVSTINGVVNNAGGSAVLINHSIFGAGTAKALTTNGALTIFSAKIGCPCLFNGTGTTLLDGACDFAGNIATADTNTVTIAQCRIATGAAQAITHNSASILVLDEVIVDSANATTIGGTGTIKIMMAQFPDTNVIAGTITQTNVGVTRTAEVWAENITRMKFTGFYSWAAAGPYFDDTTLGTFQLLVGGTGYIKNQKVTWVAQNIAGMTAGNTYWIYIDSTGTIGKTASRTDALFEDFIVLFECLRDSTAVTNNQVTVKENHPYSYPTSVSNYDHDVIGTVIENMNNGANITLVGTQGIGIAGADELEDHGLDTDIPDSGGVGVTWIRMFTLASGKWARQNATTTFTGFWNNAGTATALTAGKFGVYRLYVSKDNLNTTTPKYFAVLDIAEYNNLAAAQTAIANNTAAQISNELASLEMAQLGMIIYRESTATIVQVTISKSTLRGTTSTGSVGTASLVTTVVTNFDGILSAADTNVQAALETIDDWGKTATNKGILVGRGVNTPIVAKNLTDGQLLIGSTGNDPSIASLTAGANITITPGAGTISIAAAIGAFFTWTATTVNAGMVVANGYVANKAGLLTMTLPATAAIGDMLAITGINTAVGWRIAQNANQQIFFGDQSTTVGVGGYIEATAIRDSVELVCVVAGASTVWNVISSIGNITVV